MEKKKQNSGNISDTSEQEITQLDQKEDSVAPESFPRSLLRRSRARRLEYFEKEYVMEHPHMQRACDDILQALCFPSSKGALRRLGSMVIVIGPSRVGKTTLIGQLEKQIMRCAKKRMEQDPGHMPYVTVNIPGEGRFDWVDYYRAVLRQLHDPFLKSRASSIRGRDLRTAMENSLIQRSPFAVIIDEAHHLARSGSGEKLQEQLNQLKHFENQTGVSHVLVGTYAMRPFRVIDAQLACRSIDVHFPRYDATQDGDRALFRSIVWAFQRQLPLEEEPPLYTEHWEYLYARSVGCVGLLKLHLDDALAFALKEGASTLTMDHLERAEMTEDRLKLNLSAALAGENELAKRKGANERLLAELGLRQTTETPASSASEKGETSPKRRKQQEPFQRKPSRDPIGPEIEEGNKDSEQVTSVS